MERWKAAEILVFWTGVIILFVGILQSLVQAGPYYHGLDLEVYNVLSYYVPYIAIGAIFLAISRVCVYAGKPSTPYCPVCGQHLRYIEQYQRWYCDFEKKYVTLTSEL
jgi:hypothetical protein